MTRITWATVKAKGDRIHNEGIPREGKDGCVFGVWEKCARMEEWVWRRHANPGIERKACVWCMGAVWKMTAWRESLALPRNSSKTPQNLPSALRIVLDTTSPQSFS